MVNGWSSSPPAADDFGAACTIGPVPTALEELEALSQPSPPSSRRRARAAGLATVALAAMVVPPGHGAVILTLTPSRGIHAGDALLALTVLTAGTLLMRSLRSPPRSHKGPAAIVALAPAGTCVAVLALLNLNDAYQATAPTANLAVALGIASVGGIGAYLLARSRAYRSGPAVPSMEVLVPAVVIGYLVDSAVLPSGTAFGPMLLATCIATASGRRAAHVVHYAVLAVGLAVLNVTALTDIAGLDVVLAHNGGGVFRTLALGTVLAIGGVGDVLLGNHDACVARAA